ncbi:MAG: 2-dehydropantoate 2-reductase N-terminal domain-containing protein [Burkholderiaceae bacterium]
MREDPGHQRHLRVAGTVPAPAATVLVVQNGVDNVRRVQAELDNPVFPAVVYVAASMAGPGTCAMPAAAAC